MAAASWLNRGLQDGKSDMREKMILFDNHQRLGYYGINW